MPEHLRLPALEVTQRAGRKLYMFAVDGKLVDRFATISRIRRSEAGSLEGYQRPEVLSHIAEIRAYLESADPMVPNSVIIAFDSRVHFEQVAGPQDGHTRVGELVLPLDDGAPEDRPGFVVDGQQRLAAIREASIERFPICVTAFVTDDVATQTEQFILVNSTKPLPKGLIYELLPSAGGQLPTALARRRLPAALLSRLNRDEASPLKGRVQTPTNPNGVIKDNSILKLLENSLSDGVLYRLGLDDDRDRATEAMLGLAFAFWGAVREVFPDDWEKPPRKSRLLHGAGIVSLGFLMDAIAERYRARGLPTQRQFERDLRPLKDICRWSEGYWEFGAGNKRKWSEVQNTTRDITLLTNYLLVQYKTRVWNRAPAARGRQMVLRT